MDGHFDVLVLGGGAAGCVLAARLSEDPARTVCLVEAGPDFGPLADGRWPADVLDPHRLPVSHDWGYDDGPAWSARILGGCSSHNACFLTWGHDSDYEGWGDGWSGESLEPFRRRAEDAIGLTRAPRTGPWNDAVFDAAREAGFDELGDLNAADAITGVGRAPVNERQGMRWNAALAYLEPARGRENLTIVDRALVDRLEIRDGRLRGAHVVIDGTSRLLESDLAVLTAGAYGSPAILLRSGVGPADELRGMGVHPVADLPAVGKNLQNHWTARLLFTPGERLRDAVNECAGTVGIHMGGTLVKAASSLCEPDRWDLHLFAICWPVRDDDGLITGEHLLRISVGAMRPSSRGSVRLRSPDPAAHPLIEHRALADPDGHDVTVLADGLRQGLGIAQAPALGRAGATLDAPLSDDPEALRSHARTSLGSYFHPAGTCAMGDVVGPDGRVHGIDGLVVCDASVLPDVPRANTHLSVLAVAERLAARLAAGR